MTSSDTADSASARHIHVYVVAWSAYFGLLLLMPVRYGKLQSTVASVSLLLWVAVSTLVAYLLHHRLAGSSRGLTLASVRYLGQPLRQRDLRRLIWLSLAMSVVGFFCLAYDRIVLQGVDFSQGIAVARGLWRRSGEEREGVSSIFSVMGYLLAFSFCAGTTVAHLHWEQLSRNWRRWVILGVTILVLANSLLTGGRSIVMVQVACIAATGAIRAMIGRPMLPGRGARIAIGVTLGVFLSLAYSIYVFSARANAGNALPELYARGMLEYLGAQPTDSFSSLRELPPAVATTAQFTVVAGAYVTHSYGTFESVLEMQVTSGNVSFGFIRALLARLGVARPATEDWLLSGRFLSLPGSLWYDFGWFGFYLGAVVIGVLLGVFPRVVGLPRGGGVALCAALLVLITGLLAPLLLAIDILSVPFLVLGFLLLDVANRLCGGPSNWIYVSRPVRDGYIREVV